MSAGNTMKCPHCGKEIDMALLASRMGMKGGASTSEEKQNAARENGRKGGRPRKNKSTESKHK